MEVLVLVDFEGQPGDELKITAGDIIQKVQPGPEEGWLQGELNGRVGLFPQQFVQEIPTNLRADGTQRYPRSLRGVHAGKKLPTMKQQRWCQVNFSYAPTKEDELELCPGELVQVLEEIEDGWWLGKKNGKLGAFPSNFVQELSSLPTDLILMESKLGVAKQRPKMSNETFLLGPSEEMDNVTETPAPQIQANSKVLAPQTENTSLYCQAMFDYEPEHEDELQLKKGDKILLLSKETADLGWWEGENRGKRGLFPDNFVMPLTQVDSEIKTKVPARKKESSIKPGKKVLPSGKVEMKHPGEAKDSKEQKKPDLPKLNPPLVKKAAPPPPPVPAKTKTLANLLPKTSGLPVSGTTTPGRKGKCKDTPDASVFDALLVPSARLSHPTASRPKVPGKRPPSQLMVSLADEEGSAEPSNPKDKIKSLELVKESPDPIKAEPLVSVGEVHQQEEQAASLEDLRMELQTLKTLMDLMRVQHQKDMEELKAEMGHEQTKRAALQAEIEWLKQTVPMPESRSQAGKHFSPGNGAKELAEPGALPNPPTPGNSKD